MSLNLPAAHLERPPATRWRPSTRLLYVAAAAACLVALPVLALAVTALSREALTVWPHLAANVLPVAMTHAAINRDLGLPGRYTAAVESFLASLGLP